MDEALRKVIEFADRAHGDQVRKYSGERYIAHPVRVMETCRRFSNSAAVLAAAILHDVLEDTTVAETEIRSFLHSVFPHRIADQTISLVTELTDVYTTKAYPGLNRRQRRGLESERLASVSPDAHTIKCADIIDNARDIYRHDPDFAPVYLGEAKNLLVRIDKGNPRLHEEAKASVEECLKAFKKKPA